MESTENSSKKMRKLITIRGLVQGVGFRHFTNKTANFLNISGFVKNLPNGNVEIEAQSTKEILEQFIKELWIGSSYSNVKDISTSDIPEVITDSNFRVSY